MRRIIGSPLGRAGLACLGILGLAALAQAVLPLACSGGASFCRETTELADLPEAALAAEPEPEIVATPVSVPAAEIVVASTEPAPLAPPTPTAQDLLIAGSFAALDAPAPALTSRTVHTLAVRDDGTPVAPEPLVAAAEPPAASPPVAATTRRVGATPDVPDTSLAYAPASGDSATVTGAGANVRSKPAKGGSEVLFALAGGAEVTIVERSRGWARIVDERGRSGWIYSDYLRR